MAFFNFGAQSTIEHLSHKLLQRWVPKWYEAFSDEERGGFYERLGQGFTPIQTGQRRLLTQCRQLAIYGHAVQHKYVRLKPDLLGKFDFIVNHYHVPETGGWLFSVDEEGQVLDRSYDLYGLAFVIFAFSHYYRATGDERAREYAAKTITFIDKAFRIAEIPGLCEALDHDLKPIERIRRHESHMHFLEACLFAAETFKETAYDDMADEMVMLFREYFFDSETSILSEYFDQELRAIPDPDKGQVIVEPGHYCEWIWLLKKHAVRQGDAKIHDDLCLSLIEWNNENGWDREYGGIYDELAPDGTVIEETKRLWPFAEALKANVMMLDSGTDKVKLKRYLHNMIVVFKSHYMEDRGFWTEWLSRDLKPATDYMPGTTPYHVYFGIMEAREVLEARDRGRGHRKSLGTTPFVMAYTLRRILSEQVKRVRMLLSRFKAQNG